MMLDFEKIQSEKSQDGKPSNPTPQTPEAENSNPANPQKSDQTTIKKKEAKKIAPTKTTLTKYILGAILGTVVVGSVLFGAYKMGQSSQTTSLDEVKAYEPKKIDKLPFELPDFIKGKVVDILKFDSFYLVGTELENGQIEYLTLSNTGRFTLLGYVIDNQAKTVIFDVNGRTSDDARKNNRITEPLVGQSSTPANETGSATDFPTTSQLGENGLPEAYFKVDFTSDKTFVVPAKGNAQTVAIGNFKANPDLFVRHLFEQTYKTTLNSDSIAGKYAQAPMSPLYVFYDPRCPACQAEMPIVEQYRTQGYDIIYVPTGALSSDDSLQNADEAFVARTLNPAKGKEELQKTLDNGYQKSTTATPDELEQDKAMMINNTNLFKSLPTLLNSYYQDKQPKSFSPITQLGVPAVMYVDKNTGEVVFTQVDLKNQLGV